MSGAAKITTIEDVRLHLVAQEARAEERDRTTAAQSAATAQAIAEMKAQYQALRDDFARMRGVFFLIAGLAAGGGGTLGTLIAAALKLLN